MKKPEIPEILNQIVDKVLAYRPKPKSKAAKKRQRRKSKIEKEKKPALLRRVFLFGADMNREVRVCSKGDCKQEAVGFIGKFGETRTVGSPVNIPPGIPISVNYCAEHEEWMKRALASL